MSVILSVQGLSKSYGPRPLFSDITMDLRAGERVGVIGPNGCGKSTLLKLLSGLEEPDTGTRSQRRGAKLAYLAQDEVFTEGQTVREVILSALAEEPLEDHERETRTAITLTQVGFEDHDQPAHILSGGWKKRLSLARELVKEPEFLLLDEPTNHLDVLTIIWLERLLRAASFGYLVVSHDRAFLRAVADVIIEVNRTYPDGYFRSVGSFDEFAERRAEFLIGQAKQEASLANQVRRETEWLRRGPKARTTKANYRIDEAARKKEELAELKYRNAAADSANIDFVATGRKSVKLLTATNISKSLGDNKLFAGLDLLLSPGSKVGLLGPNGSGKSTLMRVLTGDLNSDSGEVIRAETLRTVMFEQGRSTLNPTDTLRQALCPNGDTVKYRGKSFHVIAWAKQFLFKPEQLEVPVADLSGGEQARIRIAQMMVEPADLLLLDEPTNDLDLAALEVLEESLQDFPGALIVISHDRELIDRLCDEVIGLDGRGGAALYGDVSQWLRAYEKVTDAEKAEQKQKAEKEKATAQAKSTKPRKLSYKEKQELEGMEAAILEAEETLAGCQAEVEKAASAGHEALTAACHAMEEAQQTVDHLYARWAELESKTTG